MMDGKRAGAFLLVCIMMFSLAASADVTIIYDPNGGSGVSGTMVLAPDSEGAVHYCHPLQEPTRPGFQFLGWLCNDEARFYPLDPAGKSINYVMESGTLTYVAKWMPEKHPVYSPAMTATMLYPDGNLYDLLEGQFQYVQQAEGSLYCLHHWYNTSSDDAEDIADGAGSAGFQYKDGKTWVYLSVWGNEHGMPSIGYCRPDSIAESFEGKGMQVLTEYPLQEFTWYNMRIQAWSDAQNTYYEQWVKPGNGNWEKYAVIRFPRPDAGFTWDCFYLDGWNDDNMPRSCLLRGYYARRQGSVGWRSLDSFTITNQVAGTGEQNVRYDCRYDSFGEDTAWIQSGGAGFEVITPVMPGTLQLVQKDEPDDPLFLK